MKTLLNFLMLVSITLLSFTACDKDDEGGNDESVVFDVSFSVKHDKLFDAFTNDATYSGDNFEELSWKTVNVSNYIYDDEGTLCARIDTVLNYGASLDFTQSLPYGNYSVISAVYFDYLFWPEWQISGESSLHTFMIEQVGYLGIEEYGTLGLVFNKVKVDADKTVNISVTPITALLTIRADVNWDFNTDKVFENIDTLEIISDPAIYGQVSWNNQLTASNEVMEGYYRRFMSINPDYYGTITKTVVCNQAILPRKDITFYPYVHYIDTGSWDERKEEISEPIRLESNKQYYITYKLLESKVEVEEITQTRSASVGNSDAVQIEHWDIDNGTIRVNRKM